MSERNSCDLEVLHKNSPNISLGIVTSAIDYVSLADAYWTRKRRGLFLQGAMGKPAYAYGISRSMLNE
jgi:hypothetical protein